MFVQKIRALWQQLCAFVRLRAGYIAVAAGAVLVGIGLAAAYGSVIDYTSSLNFCAHTCHEMESTVYQEYMHSKHFKNEQGVVVVCADCHVPHHNWPATLATKFMASFELWNHFVDREYILDKFNARRQILAEKVWAHFKATNARECKACHKYSNMVLEDQRPSVRAQHADAMKIDENCLDCHEGVTHKKFADPAHKAAATKSFDIE